MIIDSIDTKTWNQYFKKINSADIFYSNNFARWTKRAKLYSYKNKNNLAMFPFIIKDNSLFSFRYGGVIYYKYDKFFFKKTISELERFCSQNNLKKIIIRTHPFLKTIKTGEITKKEPFIFIELMKKKVNLINQISKHHLKSIHNAYQNKLVFNESNNKKYLKVFFLLYKSYLKKKFIDTPPFSYFSEMFIHLKNNLSLTYVTDKSKIIAVSIILKSKPNLFMMYGGMNKAGYKKCAKYFMIYNLIFKYKKKRYKRLILGTGNSERDSIYQFKRGFTGRDHYIYTYEKKLH